MAQPFATVDDVAARWRPLTSAEESVADVLLVDASLIIRARFPGIDAQVTSGAVDPDILAAVAAGMVKRAMIAPADGVSQESESTGPFSHSQSYANPLGNVFLTAADLILILGYQPTGQSHGFANDTTASGCGYGRVYGW
jgi:hypothetical protein